MLAHRVSHTSSFGLVLATLAVAAAPAQAQFVNNNNLNGFNGFVGFNSFNRFNVFNPLAGPQTLPRFGGPLVMNTNTGFGMSGPFTGFIGGSTLPLSTQNMIAGDPRYQPLAPIGSFNAGASFNANGFNPVGDVDSSLFFQANPNFNPFIVNGSVNGNFGVNTLNPNVNGFGQFNTSGGLFIGNNPMTPRVFLNNQNNAQVRIIRSPQPPSPTVPNRPAARMTVAPIQASGTFQMPIVQPFMPVTRTSPYMDSHAPAWPFWQPAHSSGTIRVPPSGFLPVTRTSPLMDSRTMARPAFGTGIGSSSVVFGGRAK